MLILPNTSTLIRLTNGSAGTIVAEWSGVDAASGPTYTGVGGVIAAISTATTTTVAPAPAASTVRNVKGLAVSNTHASVSQACTIEQYDGTNATVLWKGTLLAGERVIFDEAGVWTYYGADGVAKASVSSGQLVNSQFLTTGTTFTTGPYTRKIRARLQAGGGGGGGCSSVASAAAAAGGGGAGGYLEVTASVQPNTAYTVAIGAAGAANSGAAGGNGGNTTLTVGATTYTAKGGTGGPLATAVTTLMAQRGGAGGVVSTSGDINAAGAPGELGVIVVVATPVGASGAGGSSQFGGGGVGLSAAGAGNAAAGYGAGGGGSMTGASAARAGGAGTAGCIAIDEYS